MAISSNDIDDIIKGIVNQSRYRQYNSMDGSNMTAASMREAYRKVLEELEDYRQVLQANGKTEEEVNVIIQKQKDIAKEKIRNEARSDAYAAVSGGKSRWYEEKGNSLQRFGKGLGNIFGEDSFMGRIGNGIANRGEAVAASSGKAGMITAAGEMFTNVISKIGDIYTTFAVNDAQRTLNNWQAMQQTYLATIETNSKLFQRSLQESTQGISKSMSSSFSSITQGVTDSAYSAATNAIDMGTTAFQRILDDDLNKLQLANKKEVIERERYVKNLKLDNQNLNKTMGAIASTAGGIAAVTGGVALPAIAAVAAIGSVIASIFTKINEAKEVADLEKLKIDKQVAEEEKQILNETFKMVNEGAASITKDVLGFAKSISDVAQRMESNFARLGQYVHSRVEAKPLPGIRLITNRSRIGAEASGAF